MAVEDDYTAYCFDEACAYIYSKINNKEKPKYTRAKKAAKMKKNYSSFREYYADIKK